MKTRIPENHWLKTKPIAHRGLWGGDVPENSLKAYENAAKEGYPIETDVYITTDGEIVCFHDDTLKRLTGADGMIYEKSYAELSALSIGDSGYKIPKLTELLKVAEGKSPLLIEIKNQPDKKVVDRTVEILKNYGGEFAVQSFNPFFLARVKKLAPHFLRGVLSNASAKGEPFFNRFTVSKMPFNFLCKPDFISRRYLDLPLKKYYTKNRLLLAWTVTDQKTANDLKNKVDNIIFEFFIPEK